MSPSEIHAAIGDMTDKEFAAAAADKSAERTKEMEDDVISIDDLIGKSKTEQLNVPHKNAPEKIKEMGGFGI